MVTAAYTKPGSGDLLRDPAGNEVATFSAVGLKCHDHLPMIPDTPT